MLGQEYVISTHTIKNSVVRGMVCDLLASVVRCQIKGESSVVRGRRGWNNFWPIDKLDEIKIELSNRGIKTSIACIHGKIVFDEQENIKFGRNGEKTIERKKNTETKDFWKHIENFQEDDRLDAEESFWDILDQIESTYEKGEFERAAVTYLKLEF